MRYRSVARNDEISGMWKEAIRSTAYNLDEENDKLSRK